MTTEWETRPVTKDVQKQIHAWTDKKLAEAVKNWGYHDPAGEYPISKVVKAEVLRRRGVLSEGDYNK